MAEFPTVVTEHLNLSAYRKRVAAARSLIKAFKDSKGEDSPMDLSLRDTVNRLDTVLRRLRYSLRGKPALLLTPQALQQLNSPLATLEQHLQNPASLTAQQWLQFTDPLINAYRSFVHELPTESEAQDVLSGYVEKVEETLRDAERRVVAQGQRLDELEREKTALEQKILESAQRVEAQVARVDQAVTNTSESVAKATTEVREAAATAEAERKSAWQEQIATSVKQTDEKAQEQRTSFNKEIAEYENKVEAQLTAIEAHREEAGRIVALISNSGLAGHYQLVANNSGRTGAISFWVAFGLFLIPLILGIITIFTLAAGANPSWSQLAIRLGVGLSALVPAGYLAREAARLKRLEVAARQRELEFATISSFLDELNPEDRATIRKMLAAEYFAKPLVPDVTIRPRQVTEGVTTDQLLKLLENALKVRLK